MGSLLSYSGLATKIRAMQSRLLTVSEYEEMAELKSVPQAVNYLKQKPAYENIWDSLSEDDLHRGKLEQLLVNSIYNDFTKIYRFSNQKQRQFLELYFGRYEISIMKECLNKIFAHQAIDLDLSLFQSFFDKHSSLDVNKLIASKSIDDFVTNLKGTSYYQPMHALTGLEKPALFDYEMTLDLYHFSTIWKNKEKILDKKDLKAITQAYGNKFDLLNIQWIHRAKHYYHMKSADIYALLIPVNYKLSPKDISALVEAENMNVFESILFHTYYGKKYESLGIHTLEEMYTSIMKRMLIRGSKQNPYSAATIYCYLYHKEHEIDRLTTVLECIRYGASPEETMSYIFKS